MNRAGKKQAASYGFQFAENPVLNPTDIGEAEIMSAHRMNMEPHLGNTHLCKKNCRYWCRCHYL
jgi:hypothetical protein